MKQYKVCNAAGDHLVTGTVAEIAAVLKIDRSSFRQYLYRMQHGKHIPMKYIIEEVK